MVLNVINLLYVVVSGKIEYNILGIFVLDIMYIDFL